MAHPKLASAVSRSLVAATAAAMIAGPLAAAGLAADLDGATNTLTDLTCKEAKATGDDKLIKEFCPEETTSKDSGSTLEKSVDTVTTTVEKTTKETTEKVSPPKDDGGSKDGGTKSPEKVLETAPTADGGTKEKSPAKRPVGSTGDNFSAVDGKKKSKKGLATARENRERAAAQGLGYNTDGPFRPGMSSHSALTLQPFAAPLVSVPPVYELPQIAQQLFGSDSAAAADDPMVAGAAGTATATATDASPYSATGFSSTGADPTGWLAATATGLIMLVGAGHAINGGRTPKRQRA